MLTLWTFLSYPGPPIIYVYLCKGQDQTQGSYASAYLTY